MTIARELIAAVGYFVQAKVDALIDDDDLESSSTWAVIRDAIALSMDLRGSLQSNVSSCELPPRPR